MAYPDWITADGYRLTIADLRAIAERAASVIIEQIPDGVQENSGVIAELRAVIELCDAAAMTAGELTLPAK